MTTALSLEDFMAAMGVIPSRPLTIKPYGFNRFHIAGDRSGTWNGWLKVNSNGRSISFGSWKTDDKFTYHLQVPAVPSYIRAQRSQQANDAEAHRLAATKAKALKEAKEIWGAAEPPFQHAYLPRKQISGVGARQFGNRLIVPVFNTRAQLLNLQDIDEYGNKRFHRGLSLKGGFLLLGPLPKPGASVLLCEGYATGATLFENLGLPVAIAFSAGRLLEVGRIIRTLYSSSKLWVCADNDHTKPVNLGLTKATSVAKLLHGRLIVPPTIPGITDFNDLFCLNGKAALLACVEAAPPAH
ncbi:toprim domain-containing protein [Aeromonas sp. A04]|uniref:toprim domain-containing protein n=1 Tax=Aeromonas sp. A04 TaxID=3398359 RepID=UPI0038E02E10